MRTDLIERFLRGLYSAVLYLLLPVTVYHLIWRGFRQHAYFQRWDERYAIYQEGRPSQPATLWVHAVSVGEVNAAAPVVNALRKQRPDLRLLVTTITPTGSERVRALWGASVEHVYLPYDLPGAVSRFLENFKPHLALVMETELWPNLLFGCREHGVPTWILNGRLSARSLRGYRVLAPLVSRALGTVRQVAAQSQADAERFVQLGALRECVVDVGNLKYDVVVSDASAALAQECRERIGKRPVWIAASTHEGEEDAIIALHQRLRVRYPTLLLLWAPRHPERFRAITQQAIAAGWSVATRKLTHWPGEADAVFVVDTLGELSAFYAGADVAFVGGSLQPVGGHNLLEPAAVGTPVVCGPYLHNFSEIAGKMRQAGALRVGDDVDAVGDALETLLGDADARAAMAVAGRELVAQGRGALTRSMRLIEPALPPRS